MRWPARSRTLVLAVGVVAMAVFGADGLRSLGGVGALHERFGYWGLTFSVPIHIGAVVGVGGEELIAMANGLAYGLALGTLATWLGWYAGSLIQFGIGRTARADFEVERRMESMPGWLRSLPVSHPAFIILSRWLLPGVGGHVATLVPGAAGVAVGRFCWCTAIGTGIPSLGWTYAGIYFAGLR